MSETIEAPTETVTIKNVKPADEFHSMHWGIEVDGWRGLDQYVKRFYDQGLAQKSGELQVGDWVFSVDNGDGQSVKIMDNGQLTKLLLNVRSPSGHPECDSHAVHTRANTVSGPDKARACSLSVLRRGTGQRRRGSSARVRATARSRSRSRPSKSLRDAASSPRAESRHGQPSL